MFGTRKTSHIRPDFSQQNFSSGIPGIDSLLGGGLPRGTSTLFSGPPGTGTAVMYLDGGTLQPHPLEATDVGWFREDNLPTPLIGLERWVPQAFAAVQGARQPTQFDPPRDPVWRT